MVSFRKKTNETDQGISMGNERKGRKLVAAVFYVGIGEPEDT